MKGARSSLVTTLVLLALWVGSWALSYVELGRWSLVIALAIAVAKASLVALIFMELVHARASLRLTLVTAIAMVSLMIGLVAVDVVARGVG
jgi:cytochrome c oxidase subunit 4